jgi:hypothetical protein
MLRSVIEGYLDKVTERAFDLPFLALLPQLGFTDVHFSLLAMGILLRDRAFMGLWPVVSTRLAQK